MKNQNLIGEVELNYKPKKKATVKVNQSKDAADFLKSVWSNQMEYREEFMILMLSRANKIQGWVKISAGGTTGTVADPKMIFQAALLANAAAIILCHNHPSGNRTPSENDRQITKQAVAAGKLLDIHVVDHLILTDDNYFSFADEGLI
jgi:DNA repair protein RadC